MTVSRIDPNIFQDTRELTRKNRTKLLSAPTTPRAPAMTRIQALDRRAPDREKDQPMQDPSYEMTIEPATRADIPDLAGLAAAHMWDTAVGAWLVSDTRDRPAVLMAWYALILDEALESGYIDVVYAPRWGTAIWLDRTRPSHVSPHQLRRLTSACGRHASTLLHYEQLIQKYSPLERHLHLVILAASDQVTASALLAHRHQALDRTSIPAHSFTSSTKQKNWLTAAGYQLMPSRQIPDGPTIWPLRRAPRTHAGATPPFPGAPAEQPRRPRDALEGGHHATQSPAGTAFRDHGDDRCRPDLR